MAPTGIVFDSEAEGVVLNRIHNTCLWRLEGFEVGCCNGFAANQVIQAVKEPAAERIAVGAFFRVELKDEVVVEDLILKANDEWSDVASNVAEMPDVNSLGIFNTCKNVLQCFNGIFLRGNEDVDAAGYVPKIGGNCFAQFRVEDVQEDANLFRFQIVLDRT